MCGLCRRLSPPPFDALQSTRHCSSHVDGSALCDARGLWPWVELTTQPVPSHYSRPFATMVDSMLRAAPEVTFTTTARQALDVDSI